MPIKGEKNILLGEKDVLLDNVRRLFKGVGRKVPRTKDSPNGLLHMVDDGIDRDILPKEGVRMDSSHGQRNIGNRVLS